MFVNALNKGLAASLVLLAIIFIMGGRSNGQRQTAGRPDVLTCSPAPCVLPPAWPATQGFVVDAPIAANPRNPKQLLLGSDTTNCPRPSNAGFYLSQDGGASWSLSCMPKLTMGQDEYAPGEPPMLSYDHDGTAYRASFYLDDSGFTSFGFVGFQKSDDGGVTWSSPAPAMEHQNSIPVDTWMAIDASAASPYLNTVYVSGSFSDLNVFKFRVAVSHSSDGGAHWKLVPVGSAKEFPYEERRTSLIVGRDGVVYLTWTVCSVNLNSCIGDVHVLFSKSTDGGNTWSKPQTIAVVNEIYPLPNTSSVRVFDTPVIGVDNTDGPYSGNLYVAMYVWTGSYMRVGVMRSIDGGNTWSRPVPVAPASDTHDQFFPWLSVSPTGLVGVSWLDRRNDPANVKYQAFAAISRDGGQSFLQNVQLTQAFSDPNVGTASGWMGDYTGNTWAGPNFVAAWMDNSNSTDMVDIVGGIRLK